VRHNKLGRTGLDVSIIGLGMEHLTAAETIAPVVHRALDRGVNYVDIMIWRPELQSALGAALEGRRDQVVLAGHLGVDQLRGMYRRTRDARQCETLFHDLLSRLHTDYLDLLYLTNLDSREDYRRVVAPGGVLELVLRLKQQGKARFVGLSGHKEAVALRAVKAGHLDVVMHPIHIANADPEKELCHTCARLGVGLVAMKPFAGGELFQRGKPISPIPCLAYTLSQPGVSAALLGVKNVEELEADLAFLEASDEEKDFAALLGELQQGLEGRCVYCNHCLPCPADIDVGATLRMLVTGQQGMSDPLRASYDALPARASACIECGLCMERCPFGVDVVARMNEAADLFEAHTG